MLSSICWKFCIVPWDRYTLYRRGIWMSQTTFSENAVVEDPAGEGVPLRQPPPIDLILYSAIWYLFASRSLMTSLVTSARNRPRIRLSCLMNTS